jgi:hypothetical protein
MAADDDNAAIVGLDIRQASACRCGCDVTRITLHSKRSSKLILRCPWCNTRRGWPSEAEVKALKVFVGCFGWNMRPIIIGDSGVAHVA